MFICIMQHTLDTGLSAHVRGVQWYCEASVSIRGTLALAGNEQSWFIRLLYVNLFHQGIFTAHHKSVQICGSVCNKYIGYNCGEYELRIE